MFTFGEMNQKHHGSSVKMVLTLVIIRDLCPFCSLHVQIVRATFEET
jgi:hypothetical protein